MINNYKPRAIINFAAETHVDNSIEEPCSFIHSNVNGTYTILKSALEYYQKHIQPNNKYSKEINPKKPTLANISRKSLCA